MKATHKKRKLFRLLTGAFFCINFALFLPSVSATSGLGIYPTSAAPGETVDVWIDIAQNFADRFGDGSTITGDSWENYVNLRYVALWDCGGSEEYQPQYWTIIGSGYVDQFGLLQATATIPSNAVAGYHDITVVYEHNDQNYMDWWKGSLTVLEDGGGNGGGNGGDDVPGFELVLMLGALIGVALAFRQKKMK